MTANNQEFMLAAECPANPVPVIGVGSTALLGSVVWKSECGRVTLYNADCRDVLPTLGPVDAVITDPPYGIGEKMQGGGRKNCVAMLKWDAATVPDIVMELPALAPLCVIWGGNYYPLPCTRGWLVWHKPDAVPTMANAELAWTNRDMNTRQISWTIAATNAERVGHPTQKPVRVMSWGMEQVGVPENALVLDPFMGSASTAVACIRAGKRFVGVERDEGYFALAVQRIKAELSQGDLFLPNASSEPMPAASQSNSQIP